MATVAWTECLCQSAKGCVDVSQDKLEEMLHPKTTNLAIASWQPRFFSRILLEMSSSMSRLFLSFIESGWWLETTLVIINLYQGVYMFSEKKCGYKALKGLNLPIIRVKSVIIYY